MFIVPKSKSQFDLYEVHMSLALAKVLKNPFDLQWVSRPV